MEASDPRDPSTFSARELIEAVLDGEADMYEHIVRRYQPDVFRIVRMLIYDRTAVDDVVQQVFINAYTHLSSFDVERDPGPWFRTIARNAVREYLRKTSRYSRRLLTYADMLEQADESYLDDDDAQRCLMQALRRCLEALPSRSAEAVALRYYEDLSYKDMAAKTGSKPGALRNLLARVRHHLRLCVEKDIGHHE